MTRSFYERSVCCLVVVVSICITFVHSYEFRILQKHSNSQNNLLLKSRTKRQVDEEEIGRSYLVNYGYVSPGSLHSDAGPERLQSWRKALLSMQAFFGLKQTGRLDEETLELMRRPRCGNPDKDSVSANLKRKRRYVKVDAKWDKSIIKYSINNFTPKLGEKLTHEAIDEAFAVWSRHSPLRFRKVSFHEKPDIVIYFAEGFHNDNTPFDGRGGYLAHAFYPGTGIGGDTHFDDAEEWTLHKKAYEGNDLFLVAVHELGHALGLGHSTDQQAIMAPVYRYHNTKTFKLPKDDIEGIQSIYGKPNSKPREPFTPKTTKRPRKTTTIKPKPTTTTTHKFVPTRSRRPRPTTKPATPKTTTLRTTTTKPPRPELCKLRRYDAVSFLRGELFIFSGEYMWRQLRNDDVIQGPYKISDFWPELKNGVNAVYENIMENKIVFFKDHLYYEYDGLVLQEKSPRPVRFLGLQNEHVGAAVWWERNGKTYLFQGSYYWRIKESRVEKDYPKHIRAWNGVPPNVDAVFSGGNTKGLNYTFFVKGTQYWKFNNWKVEVVGRPRSFQEDWLGCPPAKTSKRVLDEEQEEKVQLNQNQTSISPALIIGVSAGAGVLLFVAIIILIVFKRRREMKNKPITGVMTSTNPSYSPGYTEPTNTKNITSSNPKKLHVNFSQQKLRWLRLSLQSKV